MAAIAPFFSRRRKRIMPIDSHTQKTYIYLVSREFWKKIEKKPAYFPGQKMSIIQVSKIYKKLYIKMPTVSWFSDTDNVLLSLIV